MRRSLLLPLCIVFACGSLAAKPPKLGKDSPLCPRADAKQIFVSPAGEPFRAAQGTSYPVADWLAQADRDRDGRLSRPEFLADADRFFGRIDSDADGEIEPVELSAYEQDIAPEISLYRQQRAVPMAARGKKQPAAPYGGMVGAARFGLLDIPHPIAASDLDYNRGVSRAEFAVAANGWFDRLDTARAGALALATLPQTPAQARAALPCRPPPVADTR